MRVLLDTQVVVRAAVGEPLPPRFCEVMRRDDIELFVSAISIWEIRMKWRTRYRSGDRKLDLSPDEAIAWADRNAVPIVPLEGPECAVEISPPVANNDPYDDMIAVHAHLLGARLLTTDGDLRRHPLALVP
ncbi:type II toxin-antitoxin system VapC family toxin [Sphingomonas lenta]|uniref:PIN domain-containing protein n=1 Tax=Sphingomonas lenta TaxID=1141887 RepID=A0A2A2SFX3_9SPHN|nr:PIN domain-containing protein [Sphingomonas lenta]PAX08102.1 hypothetical protein CKY28_10975 [Sphingomonas lenta]